MSRRADPPAAMRRRALAAIPLAVVLFVALNLLADALPSGWSLDVTASGRHTLSNATHRTLGDIPEPIALRLYISPAVRADRGQRGRHAERVEAMLRRYARLAEGGLVLEVLRPEPFSETEDQALADGLRPIRVGARGQTGYFGLVGRNSTDDQETIAAFDPERAGLLEADLTRLVHSLAHPRKPVVGLLGRISLRTETDAGGTAPNRIRRQLAQQVALRDLSIDSETLPDDLDALVLAQPTGLGAATVAAVHDFVADGGHVLAFVDPLSEALHYRREPLAGARAGPEVNDLLAPWGLRLAPERFVADRAQALTVRARVGGRDTDIPYVGWAALGAGSLAATHPVTAGLGRLVVKSPGALRPTADAAVTPLAHSSAESALMPVARIADGPNPSALLNAFPAETARAILAAEVQPGPGRVVVVADSDLLRDSAWSQGDSGRPVADNASFVLNAVERLTGGDALAGLPGGTRLDRPFTRIERLRREAEQRYRAREARLIDTVTEARQALGALRRDQAERGTAPTEAERERVGELRSRLAEARRELRDVQHNLRADVARIERRARLANVWGVPAAVAVAAGGLVLLARARRRRRARAWIAEDQARAEAGR